MVRLIINLDSVRGNDPETFPSKFSAPQWKDFVTVRMGRLHWDGSITFSEMLRQVSVRVPISGQSHFLVCPG